MKNGCIVARNIFDPISEQGINAFISALIDGGYRLDKIFFLSDADEREFSQTFAECKNFFENVFVIAEGDKLPALRALACGILKVQDSDEKRIGQGQKTFFFLENSPSLAACVQEEVAPFLDGKYGVKHDRLVVRAVGVPEEKLKAVLAEVKELCGNKLAFGISENGADVRIQIVYDADSPKMLTDEVMRVLVSGLNDYIYALDDTPLNACIYEMLKVRHLRLSVGESFTGGGVAKRLIEVPGISSVLFESVVAYDNGSKMKRLGVSAETLAKHGAVSDETAYEMAAGLLASGNCNVSLATTGIAGPQSDNTNKPVGLCYIAVGLDDAVYVYKYIFKGGREAITARAIDQALFLLYKQIK